MSGPSNAACSQLKECMANHVISNPARRTTLHHIKMAAGIVEETADHICRDLSEIEASGGHCCAGASNAVATESQRRNPLCAWIYAGSHNLSGAAWGKIEVTDDEQARLHSTRMEPPCMLHACARLSTYAHVV